MHKPQNNRKSYRIHFSTPIVAPLKIVQINGTKVASKPALVFVNDLSAGGLRFHTELSLPSDKYQLILEFAFELLEQKLLLLGSIVRKVQNDQLFEYGVKFIIDGADQDKLHHLVTKLQQRMRTVAVSQGIGR